MNKIEKLWQKETERARQAERRHVGLHRVAHTWTRKVTQETQSAHRALRVIYCYYVFRVQKLVYLFIYFSRCSVCVCAGSLCNSHAGERVADSGHAHANAQYLYADSHSAVRCTCQLIPLCIHRVGIYAITPGPFKRTVCSSARAALANECLCAPWLKRPAHSARR